MNDEERRLLRATLRQARRQLSINHQRGAAQALAARVIQQDFYNKARFIAFYQKIDGEIDPAPILDLALSEGKTCFLPVITDANPDSVSFAPYTADTRLTRNQWGIAEPPTDFIKSPAELDLVFVPLVGFDANCSRLGMGMGFYDRTFSFKIADRHSQPLLVGLAHECQLTAGLATASWDVRLDAVITEEKIYRPEYCQGGNRG